jgi:hypothetical protein
VYFHTPASLFLQVIPSTQKIHNMQTFNSDPKIKDHYISRLQQHQAADEIIQGTYWQNGKGCAVGCTIHSDSHRAYETELGIPMILARLEDRIFEGMSNIDAKEFPLRFLQAVPVGVDLKDVYKKFFVWMLTDSEHGVIKFANNDATKKAIQDVSDLLQKSLLQSVTNEQFLIVAMAARNAAYAAYAAYAAADAAYAAYAAADAADAAYAAYAAAYAAADAAAAYAAAADAAYAAAADAAYADAAYAAKQKHFLLMGNKLIEIIASTTN